MPDQQARYLRPDVVIEPLINHWPAQLQLLAPVTAALTITRVHRGLLESFVDAPDLHLNAARQPELSGGSFVDIAQDKVSDAKSLLRAMHANLNELFDLANAVSELNRVLSSETRGLSLHGVYGKVPECLRGFVELVYDGCHNPRIRYLEPLLYKSRLYREDLQSVHLWRADGDGRSSMHSTPRLDDAASVTLSVPFRDAALDALARARREPARVEALSAALGVTARDMPAFESFFTDTPPLPRNASRRGGGARVRYLGHAGVLVETERCAVLVDPVLGYGHKAPPPRYTFADLPARIDAVLITHGHPDHFNLENLLQLRHAADRIIVPRSGMGSILDPSLEHALRAAGFGNVTGVEPMDRIAVGDDLEILALPFFGEHGDMEICSKTCYGITAAHSTFVLGADAATPDPRVFDLVKGELGDVEAVFLAMEPHGAPLRWGYAHLFARPVSREMDRSRRQRAANADEIIAMLERMKPKRFYNYAMGLEPWMFPILGVSEGHAAERVPAQDTVADYCSSHGIEFEKPFASMELLL